MYNINYKLLGLMYASKNIVLGQDNIVALAKQQKVKIVLLSNNASDRTKKLIIDKCTYNNIDYYILEDKDDIMSKELGKKSIKVVATNNRGFVKNILDSMKEL